MSHSISALVHGGLDTSTFATAFWATACLRGMTDANAFVLIMPAFVSAPSIGFYATATNVSRIVGSIFGALATIVLQQSIRGNSGKVWS
jgi:hypothetical protein